MSDSRTESEPIEILFRGGPKKGQPRPHGEPTTYKAGCRCKPCRKAVAADVRASYGRRVGTRSGRRDLPPGVEHGTLPGYRSGCTCEPCRKASTEDRRKYRARHRDDDPPTVDPEPSEGTT